MELYEPALIAAMAARADERATPRSRTQTARFTAAEASRARGSFARDRRGFGVSANFFLDRSTSKAVRARSRTAASSAVGIAWLSMSVPAAASPEARRRS